MNHDYIIDQDLVGLYRLGMLDAAEAEVFEAHLIGCELCLGLLAADAQLGRGLRVIAADRVAPPRRTVAHWRSPRRIALAAAAVLAMVAVVPALWHGRTDPQADIQTFHLPLTRGPAPAAIELTVSPRVAWYALELEAPPTSTTCCRVVIEDGEGNAVWEGESPVAPDTGMVRVLLSRSILQNGSYRIVLYATAALPVRLVEHQVLVRLDR